jgi:hypothetical protein
MGRKNDEATPARFPKQTLARLDSLLNKKEKRSNFIREAVEREIKRRKASQGSIEAEVDRTTVAGRELRRDVDAGHLGDDAVQAAVANAQASASQAAASVAGSAASALGVYQFDTRAQAIAATIPVDVQAIRVTRYATGHPLSDATYVPGTSSGPMAFQEAGGHYWQLDLSGGDINPHWFGALPALLGTTPTDSTAAIQAAINGAGAVGGGVVHLGRGAYGITGININSNNIFIEGSGVNATTLVHQPTAPSVALYFSAGAGSLSNTGVSDLAIGSNDTVVTKVAIAALDSSFFTVRNVSVAHYPVDGTLLRASAGTGIALSCQGREHGTVQNFKAYAEQPIRIGVDPNITGGAAMDSWVFRDCVLISNIPTQPGPYNVITIDNGVALTNVIFEGYQNWIGGTNGLHWVDTSSTQISVGLYISGVKFEQACNPHGYAVLIQHHTALHSFHMDDCMLGDRNGINLKKVYSTKLSNLFYDHNSAVFVGSDGFGLAVDGTDAQVIIDACTWTGGTLASISGLTARGTPLFVTGNSMQLPTNGVYTV